MNKYDLDAASKRIHVLIKYAILCITIVGRIAYLLLRLPFGTTPADERFCTISKTVADLAQDIINDKTRDPSDLLSDLSDQIPEAESPKKVKTLNQPLFKLMVPVEMKTISVDVYVDDITTIVLALSRSLINKAKHGVPPAHFFNL